MTLEERLDVDYDRPLSVDEMCNILRGAGESPYCFLRLAVGELTVKDNRQAAEGYAAYAAHFISKFFDAKEDLSFQVMVDTVQSFITLWERYARDSKGGEG